MHELDGVGDEYVAIREWEQREWEKGEDLAAGSGSLGKAFASMPDTTTIKRIEQLLAIVDKSSPQEVQESRAVQELGDWGDDGEEEVLIGAMVFIEGFESSITEIPPVNALSRSQVRGITGTNEPGSCLITSENKIEKSGVENVPGSHPVKMLTRPQVRGIGTTEPKSCLSIRSTEM